MLEKLLDSFLGSLLSSFFEHLRAKQEEKRKATEYVKAGAAKARQKGLEKIGKSSKIVKRHLSERSASPFERLRDLQSRRRRS